MNTTEYWLIGFGVIIMIYIGYDIYADFRWGYKETFSYIIYTAAKTEPIIAWAIGGAMGLLSGHLFWPQ